MSVLLEERPGVSREPLFFVSYAHTPGGVADDSAARFFEELSDAVLQYVPRDIGEDPGFMDTDLQSGERWNAELLHAVGTTQVFVPLLSRHYLESEWCAMEWHGFSQREVRPRIAGAPSQTAILPVRWLWPARVSEPEPVKAVQRFQLELPDNKIVEHYKRRGLLDLRRTRMDDDAAFRAVIWRIAGQIAAILDGYEVVPKALCKDDLRNIFREPW